MFYMGYSLVLKRGGSGKRVWPNSNPNSCPLAYAILIQNAILNQDAILIQNAILNQDAILNRNAILSQKVTLSRKHTSPGKKKNLPTSSRHRIASLQRNDGSRSNRLFKKE